MTHTFQKTMCLLAFTSLSFFFFSCSKKDEAETKTALISKSPWIMSKFEGRTNNGAWTDGYASLPGCVKDNKATFAANGVFTLDEGATKCSSGDPQTTNLSWSFGANETTLTFGTGTFTIEELTATTLVYSSSSTNNGTTYATRYTFTH